MNTLKERLKEVRLFHKIRLKELRNKKYKSPEEFEEYHLLQQKVKEKPKKAEENKEGNELKQKTSIHQLSQETKDWKEKGK
jgi:hypothetical protein